jgi:hypothetical protein
MRIPIIATIVLALLAASCITIPPEKRIGEADFNDRPAVIKDLEEKGEISKESAALFYSNWKAERDEEIRKQQAFERWYRNLSPQQQLAYEQSQMQARAAALQGLSLMMANNQNNLNASLDRQAYDRRTQALEAPQQFNHNIQGTIYHY